MRLIDALSAIAFACGGDRRYPPMGRAMRDAVPSRGPPVRSSDANTPHRDRTSRLQRRPTQRELRAFATSLKSDFDAVNAGLTAAWNNGQLEGQVNRLKLIKRQMYGHANFDRLRKRVQYSG